MSTESMLDEAVMAAETASDDTTGTTAGGAQDNETTGEKLYADKYKSVEDLERGYRELSTKVRAKESVAPEQYSFDFSSIDELKDFDAKVLDEDPMYKGMLPIFKDLKLSNEQANKLVSNFLMLDRAGMPNKEVEEKALGAEKDEIISRVSKFVARNAKMFDAQEHEEIKAIASTAIGMRLLDKLQKLSIPQSIPPKVGSTNTDDIEELTAQVAQLYREAQKDQSKVELYERQALKLNSLKASRSS